MNPTIPQQATSQGTDDEIELDDVEPDRAAIAHSSTRHDNGTGTDTEGALS